MNKKPELADVFRRFYASFLLEYSVLPSQARAARDIMNCMTEAMGGGRYRCDVCGEDFWSYHGCRNRSCPKCHGRQTADWLQKRSAELLPCPYFHVVATVPSELRGLFKRHQKIFYGLLMQSAARAVCVLAADRRYLGAEPGILALLHTWTSKLHFHPHVHLLVTGGGADGTEWREGRQNFLVPVKKLSSMVGRRFSETLRKKHPELHAQVPAGVWKREWCSFCKPFGYGNDAVLNYLARYVFRIAIGNSRILSMDESHVTLRCKDNRTGKWRTEKIRGVEFLRRFLQHVLPQGFHKVRYYGLWSPAKRKLQLRVRLALLARTPPAPSAKAVAPVEETQAQRAGIPDETGESTRAQIPAQEAPTQIGDLAEAALRRSETEVHAWRVKCPKCQSVKVTCLQELRRGGRRMQT